MKKLALLLLLPVLALSSCGTIVTVDSKVKGRKATYDEFKEAALNCKYTGENEYISKYTVTGSYTLKETCSEYPEESGEITYSGSVTYELQKGSDGYYTYVETSRAIKKSGKCPRWDHLAGSDLWYIRDNVSSEKFDEKFIFGMQKSFAWNYGCDFALQFFSDDPYISMRYGPNDDIYYINPLQFYFEYDVEGDGKLEGHEIDTYDSNGVYKSTYYEFAQNGVTGLSEDENGNLIRHKFDFYNKITATYTMTVTKGKRPN